MRYGLSVSLISIWLSLAGTGAAYSEPTDSCTPPDGWETVADAAEGRILFVGETHGTKETPEAFANYTCAVAARGGRTLVLLELPPQYEEAMNQAMISENPRATLISGMSAHWQTQDGRGSEAMLDMMTRLMELAQSGQQIAIEPFSLFLLKEFPTPEETMAWVSTLSPEEIQERSEAGMAQEILARSADYDRTIVLVGNIHAYLALRGNPPVPSAAMRIPGALSIKVVDDGGEAWVRIAGTSGVHSSANQNPFDEPAGSIGIDQKYAPHFTGFLSVGPISASPPALSGAPRTVSDISN